MAEGVIASISVNGIPFSRAGSMCNHWGKNGCRASFQGDGVKMLEWLLIWDLRPHQQPHDPLKKSAVVWVILTV